MRRSCLISLTLVVIIGLAGCGKDSVINSSDNSTKKKDTYKHEKDIPVKEEKSEIEKHLEMPDSELLALPVKEEKSEIEKYLEMSDSELLALPANDCEQFVVLKSDVGWSIVGIETESASGIPSTSKEYQFTTGYKYQIIVFPSNAKGLIPYGNDNGDILGLGVNSHYGKEEMYRGSESKDSEYSFINELGELRLAIVKSGYKIIGQKAFCGNSKLERVVLGNTIKQINTFEGCINLQKINLPASIKSIGDNVFADCPNLTAIVDEGSYSEQYCKVNNVKYEYSGIKAQDDDYVEDILNVAQSYKQIYSEYITSYFEAYGKSYFKYPDNVKAYIIDINKDGIPEIATIDENKLKINYIDKWGEVEYCLLDVNFNAENTKLNYISEEGKFLVSRDETDSNPNFAQMSWHIDKVIKFDEKGAGYDVKILFDGKMVKSGELSPRCQIEESEIRKEGAPYDVSEDEYKSWLSKCYDYNKGAPLEENTSIIGEKNLVNAILNY